MLENRFDEMVALVKQLNQKVHSILNCKAIEYNDINN
jgi:hypothetical protein